MTATERRRLHAVKIALLVALLVVKVAAWVSR